jgi:hypothetical protein
MGDADPGAAFVAQLTELHEAACSQPDVLFPESVASLLSLLKEGGARESIDEQSSALAASKGIDGVRAAEEEAEAHPQEHVRAFVEEFYHEVGGDAEFSGLVAVFSHGVNHTILEQRAAKKGSRLLTPRRHLAKQASEATKDGTKYVRSLIEQLLALSAEDEDEETKPAQDTEQTLISLAVLRTVLEAGPADQLVERQLLLNSMGVATVALKMAACVDDALCEGGLKLSIALLDGGNAEVQRSFLSLLQDSDAHDLRAADGSEANSNRGTPPPPTTPSRVRATGSEGSFFKRVKGRLRLGVKEIKERLAE